MGERYAQCSQTIFSCHRIAFAEKHSSDKYAAYLETIAKFYNYSTRNTIKGYLLPTGDQWKQVFEKTGIVPPEYRVDNYRNRAVYFCSLALYSTCA